MHCSAKAHEDDMPYTEGALALASKHATLYDELDSGLTTDSEENMHCTEIPSPLSKAFRLIPSGANTTMNAPSATVDDALPYDSYSYVDPFTSLTVVKKCKVLSQKAKWRHHSTQMLTDSSRYVSPSYLVESDLFDSREKIATFDNRTHAYDESLVCLRRIAAESLLTVRELRQAAKNSSNLDPRNIALRVQQSAVTRNIEGIALESPLTSSSFDSPIVFTEAGEFCRNIHLTEETPVQRRLREEADRPVRPSSTAHVDCHGIVSLTMNDRESSGERKEMHAQKTSVASTLKLLLDSQNLEAQRRVIGRRNDKIAPPELSYKRQCTPKEEFREFSRRFHNKHPSKRRKEKRLRSEKIRDAPGSVSMPERIKLPYMLLD